MRTLAALPGFALLGALVVLLAWPTNSGALKQPGVVRITDVERSITAVDGGTSHIYSLFNRRLTPQSIGNAVLVCRDLHGTGPIPATARQCIGTYSILNAGTLQVAGLSLNPFSYALAVTGGTGQYANVGGTLTVTFIAGQPLRELLVFDLTL